MVGPQPEQRLHHGMRADARINPPAYVYEASHSVTRNGSSAGSTPPAKSTAKCGRLTARPSRVDRCPRAMS